MALTDTWPGVDPFAWVHPGYGISFERLDADGIAYLLCETMDGRPIAWAPLGSAKPFADGEGVAWRIRTVMP